MEKALEHNDNNLTLALNNISKEITKEYFIKEKAHQNTSIVKQKYEELLKEITKYNRILNLYKRLRKSNEKTAGDSFRNLGGNTKKVQYTQKEINDMLKEMEKDTTILSEKDVGKLLEQISNK